jgi:hypothetical protein
MRQKIAADWILIRSLYLDGMPFSELSERFGVAEGTIKARSHREKWNVVPERHKATAATPTEKSTQIMHDIWAERAAKVRESEHSISERLTEYASQMSEDQLLAKIDKLKIAVDMGRRATGLDKEEKEKASVNIAVLGDISAMPSESMIYTKPVQQEIQESN